MELLGCSMVSTLPVSPAHSMDHQSRRSSLKADPLHPLCTPASVERARASPWSLTSAPSAGSGQGQT